MDISKRSFIGLNKIHKESAAIVSVRPPWSIKETDFLSRCTQCNDCLDACPENILIEDSQHYPSIDFNAGECTFCEACVAVCKEDIFLPPSATQPWNYVIHISTTCLANHKIACQSCQDACQTSAIHFSPRIGGPSIPKVEPSNCTACGACISICPSSSIEMTHGIEEMVAEKVIYR